MTCPEARPGAFSCTQPQTAVAIRAKTMGVNIRGSDMGQRTGPGGTSLFAYPCLKLTRIGGCRTATEDPAMSAFFRCRRYGRRSGPGAPSNGKRKQVVVPCA